MAHEAFVHAPRPVCRGDSVLAKSPYKLGAFAVVMLVALRFGVGWHFFSEGVVKLKGDDFSSVGFLNGAKGPLAPNFHNMVWDADGLARLNYARTKKGRLTINLERTLRAWRDYRDEAAEHFDFDDRQRNSAADKLALREKQLEWFFDVNGEEILDYFKGLEQRQKNLQKPARTEVASLHGQLKKQESELKKKRGPWLAQLDSLWAAYERDIIVISSREQRAAGILRMPRPGRRAVDSITVDRFIPWFDLTIGVCLMLGLFTRAAATTGALFLGSIIASQWPGAVDAAPVYFQSVEMLALLALAGVSAGRFAGLDFFLHSLWLCCRPAQKQEASES